MWIIPIHPSVMNMDLCQAQCWVLGPCSHISTTSKLKELKVKGRVERSRRHPRKACNQMLTSLVKLGTGTDTGRWEPSGSGAQPARGGPHTGLLEEVLCSDTLWEHTSTTQKRKKRNSRQCQSPRKGWVELASSGKCRGPPGPSAACVAGEGRELGWQQGAGVRSGAQALSGLWEAMEVTQKGATSQTFDFEAALWLLH